MPRSSCASVSARRTTAAKEEGSNVQNRTASALVLLVLAGISSEIAGARQSDSPAPQGAAVYVADFELSSAPATASDPSESGVHDVLV
jgi:hypothetical protein